MKGTTRYKGTLKNSGMCKKWKSIANFKNSRKELPEFDDHPSGTITVWKTDCCSQAGREQGGYSIGEKYHLSSYFTLKNPAEISLKLKPIRSQKRKKKKERERERERA